MPLDVGKLALNGPLAGALLLFSKQAGQVSGLGVLEVAEVHDVVLMLDHCVMIDLLFLHPHEVKSVDWTGFLRFITWLYRHKWVPFKRLEVAVNARLFALFDWKFCACRWGAVTPASGSFASTLSYVVAHLVQTHCPVQNLRGVEVFAERLLFVFDSLERFLEPEKVGRLVK